MGHQANAHGRRPVLLHASLGKVLACGSGAGRDGEGGGDGAGKAAKVEALCQWGLGRGRVQEKLQGRGGEGSVGVRGHH